VKREIILDIETTGLYPEQGHKIIEICCMEIINGIKTGEIFHVFINPERDVPNEAFAIHGISTEFLLDKQKFSQISLSFLDFIKDAKLVIHNAKFDVGFLNYELKALGHKIIDFSEVIDTLIIARKKYPGSPASLDALCKRFKVSQHAKRDKHGALIDVELLYEVYKNLVDDYKLIKANKSEDNNNFKIEKNRTYKEPRIYNCSPEELENHEKFLKQIKEPIWTN